MPYFECTNHKCPTIYKDVLDTDERKAGKNSLCPNCQMPGKRIPTPKVKKPQSKETHFYRQYMGRT